ncbi:DUF5074 domain-containing protein [uncultured Salegentibacter sp.]|uniref:YncE family protein n=1 Tax=uncultured Salegentibacter sp. TaxID=259320 RepID=UPI00259AE6AF|nr:DUF5074 domain-containing protein [uncultured Salegentibacter sp.]
MKRISKLLSMALIGGLLLNSCSSDDDIVDPDGPQAEGDYTNGFFVLNEGSQAAGTLTYISEDLQTIEHNIYQNLNENDDLGFFAQSIFFEENLAYIISNGSNLITVVDRYTLELVGKVDSGLEVPMYGVVKNGKAYVTNQASFSTTTDDYIAVIDLETLEVEENIALNNVGGKIIEEDGLLYVQNSLYRLGKDISIINPTNNTVEKTFITNKGLADFDIEDGLIYALSKSKLEKIDLITGEIISSIELKQEKANKMEIENDKIYYTVNEGVYVIGKGDETEAEEPLFEYESRSGSLRMYGFNVEDDRIFIADGNFASNSFIEVYNLDGELIKNIEVGVGPNGFYFND